MAANGSHTAFNLGTVPTVWHIASIGDYNGDGRADILWRHTNGAVLIWTMNANGTHTAVGLGTVPLPGPFSSELSISFGPCWMNCATAGCEA